MKVLYIGVYRDGTGWGNAAIENILALDEVGVDVVCRPLKLNNRKSPLIPRIQELEAKSLTGCDVVIQHILPHDMDFNGDFAVNIGVYESETSDFKASVWHEAINRLDLAVVPNKQMVEASKRSGVTIPIRVVNHATQVEKFQTSYPHLESLAPHKEQETFLFYWAGEFVRRKNLAAALKAFYLEFNLDEPVGFVIKTGLPHESRAEMAKHVNAFCEEIKRGLKLRRYKDTIIITDRLTDTGMMRLHATCDCFVMPSYGEAWCIPAFDAMGMGRTPIVTRGTGFDEYVSDKTGWLVDVYEEPVFGVEGSFEDLYVGQELWLAASIPHLRRCMREAYENSHLRQQKAIAGVEKVYDFSHEAIGGQLKRVLDEYYQASKRKRGTT